METATFISVVNDYKLYEQCIRHNPFVEENPSICWVDFDNTQENLFIALRYNNFLNSYSFEKETWFIFCHHDWEIKENIIPKLASLDKGKLYGPIGAKLSTTTQGTVIHEHCGICHEKKRDGTNERIQKCRRTETGTVVDSFDCQCLIVHSSLVKQYKLRFDEKLKFDLYVEDFCFNAFLTHGIVSNILQLSCCHWSQLDNLNERSSYTQMLTYLNDKYKNYQFAGTCSVIGNTNGRHCKFMRVELVAPERATVYKNKVDPENSNDPRVITANTVREGSSVLDVGCACGDLGVVLHKKKKCKVTGLEYNPESIRIAMKTGCYENIYQIDLNNFNENSFYDNSAQFDHIVCGDVLEHINDPQSVLTALTKKLRAGGTLLISLPNIAHASIKMNLLIDDWTYTEVGILDKTHIKFFTRTSIPLFLAETGLIIKSMKYTVLNKAGTQPNKPWKKLPFAVKYFICKNPHSFVCQYVVEATPAPKEFYYGQLTEINEQMFIINKTNMNKDLKQFCLYRYRLLKAIKSFVFKQKITKENRLKIKLFGIQIVNKSLGDSKKA